MTMRRVTTFSEANKQLQQFVPPALSDRKYSLDTMKLLMEHLGNPQDKVRVIHVAGTSGKTSTCYYIAAMLHAAGKKAGLTVSPHIDEINERVQIGMKPLDESNFCQKLQEFLQIIDDSKLSPSYFEVLAAFAYWVFASEQVDYAVVEVGLGGLLDGTNVVTRADKVCVITDIGLDHTHILGSTLQTISLQKAGIIQPSNEVFLHQQDKAVMHAVNRVCQQKQAHMNEVPESDPPLSLPLFQRRNWTLARGVFEYLVGKLPTNVIEFSVQTIVPARMEIIERSGKIVIIDGSHNEQKLHALAQSLLERFPDQPIAALVSFGHNKEATISSSTNELTNFASHIIFTKFHMGQDEYRTALEPSALKRVCAEHGFYDVAMQPNPEEALGDLLHRPEKILLVTGSFYLLNHIRPLLMA